MTSSFALRVTVFTSHLHRVFGLWVRIPSRKITPLGGVRIALFKQEAYFPNSKCIIAHTLFFILISINEPSGFYITYSLGHNRR
jgi:hypothetical protein